MGRPRTLAVRRCRIDGPGVSEGRDKNIQVSVAFVEADAQNHLCVTVSDEERELQRATFRSDFGSDPAYGTVILSRRREAPVHAELGKEAEACEISRADLSLHQLIYKRTIFTVAELLRQQDTYGCFEWRKPSH